MVVKFTKQQNLAMSMIGEWFCSPIRRPFMLNGYAGTGKTTIAKYINQEIGCETDEVIYIAPTGKAASALLKKECEGATTIHKLLYKPLPRTNDKIKDLEHQLLSATLLEDRLKITDEINKERKKIKLSFSKEPDFERINKSEIIVVDETSMVNTWIANDLINLGKPVIFSGDRFQLKPVEGISPIHAWEPNILLTEVCRQGLLSPVLALATDLRTEKKFDPSRQYPPYNDEWVKVVSRLEVTDAMLLSADQVLCYTNRTRFELNRRIRKMRIDMGEVKSTIDSLVGVGDKILFLYNQYDLGLINGTQAIVSKIEDCDSEDHWIISGKTDNDIFEDHKVWNGAPKVPERQHRMEQFIDLAYAMTCHKAQGSEWEEVLIYYEPKNWDRYPHEDKIRWLYTAATRAKKRVTIVLDERRWW